MKSFLSLILLGLFTLSLVACEQDKLPDPDPEIIVEKTSETYLEGTLNEFTVYKFETKVEGPTAFIIGGIHGNERAGWMAAQSILNHTFTRGTVYVLPMANRQASLADPPVRFLSGWTDLNRAFPGDPSGTQTQRLAHAIFSVMAQAEPDYVLDLHESRYSYTNNGLGDAVILHNGLYSLFMMDLLETFNAYEFQIGQTPFTYLNSPPVGSINREFTETYNVPVFTLETNRNSSNYSIDGELNPLALRIQQQLALIQLFLEQFGK